MNVRARVMGGLPPRWRFPLLAAALLSMAIGALAGLARSGVPVPLVRPTHVELHAVLMFGGFFGTVISLERAVAHGRSWAYLAPVFAAAGAVVLWSGGPSHLAARLQLVAGILLVVESWRLHVRQPQLHSRILVLGAACWPAATLVWMTTRAVEPAVGLWVDFLVLTIAGERLELSRLMPPAPRARALFAVLVGACLAGGLAATLSVPLSRGLLGVSFAALAVWLVRHDIARRTARSSALTGFIGRSLLAGYFWLVIGGALMAAIPLSEGPWIRDAAMHAVLLGFVMSMVLGHAPIIFPAVLRLKIPYHPVFYLPLVLLHGSLLLRVGGDLAASAALRADGALLNAIALAAFVAVTAGSAIRGALQSRASSRH